MISRTSLRRRLCWTALALCLCAAAARADTDYTDSWYEGAAAGGWGVSLTQNDRVIFASFFLYDASNKPIWFGGTMTRVANGAYAGTLYVALSGDFYGNAPFNPALNAFAPAGTMSFTATDPGHGVITYSVGATFSGTGAQAGRTVAIQRQSLAPLDLSGTYAGAEQFSLSGSGCGTQATPQTFLDQMIIAQTPTAAGSLSSNMTIGIYDPADGAVVCRMTGVAVQTGKTLEIADGTTSCPSGGTSTPVRVYDMRVTANAGVEMRWTTSVNGCTVEGRMSTINVLKAR